MKSIPFLFLSFLLYWLSYPFLEFVSFRCKKEASLPALRSSSKARFYEDSQAQAKVAPPLEQSLLKQVKETIQVNLTRRVANGFQYFIFPFTRVSSFLIRRLPCFYLSYLPTTSLPSYFLVGVFLLTDRGPGPWPTLWNLEEGDSLAEEVSRPRYSLNLTSRNPYSNNP